MQNWRIVAAGAIVGLRSLDLVRETYVGADRIGRVRLAAQQRRHHDGDALDGSLPAQIS